MAPVIDAWFDSGAMPAAQVGYPHVEGSAEAMQFPAQLVAEAIDQTRGWFYSLLAVNTLVFGATPYEHVLCLGHIVDEFGRKMSKSVGNVIDPWDGAQHARRGPAALVDVLPGFAVDLDARQPRRHRRVAARDAGHALEHVQLLHHLRVAQRL